MYLDEIIHGDSAEVLKTFPPEYIDLTVTSPPYDNLRKYNGYHFDFPTIAKELYRATKAGGVVVWVVGDATINGSETGTSFRQALFFKECGFNLHDTMIYKKVSTATHDPRNKRYKQVFEYMFVFSKGKPNTYNEIKDEPVLNKVFGKKRTSRNPNGTMRKIKDFAAQEFQARGNVWIIKGGFMQSTKDKYAFEHPAIFPEALARDHIITWSNEGDVVLDCFAGSGTTLKMAKLLNRHYIGIDTSIGYVELSRKRLGA